MLKSMAAGNLTNSHAPLLGPKGEAGRLVGISATAPSFPSWKGIAVVLALTFAVYIPTLRYQFVHDDRGQILDNPAVHSWHFVPTYFTSHVWAGVMPEGAGNFYRPLFLLWLRINDALFGNHAWGWHSTTILVHVFTTLLVYLLACRLGISGDAALVAALIFGLHPAHIEAVAWISGVTEPLLGFLLLASFLAYVRWRLEGARKWKLISLALFALALGEKETALILPGLLLAYDWIFGTEWGRPLELRRILVWCGEALRRSWPYFLLLVLYVPARIYALKGFSHAMTLPSNGRLVLTWPLLIWFWIRHHIWPAGLSTFYDFPAVIHPALKNFILPSIFDLCVALALFVAVRQSRTAAFSAIWLVLPLIPPSLFCVFIANDFAHDRYLYLPSVGFAILIALLLKKVCGGAPQWQGIPVSLLAAALCLVAILGFGTVTQSFYFHDNLTFYTYNFSRAPHNPTAESDYAAILAERGMYGPALEKFNDVVNHNPDNWAAIYDLALTYYKMGNLPQAEKYFLEAIRVNPYKPDEHLYLGMTRYKSGRTDEAIASVRRAIAINPTGAGYHFALGMMLETRGDLDGAIQEFKQELAINPEQQAAVEQIKELENRQRGTRP
jgi:4-amino-4-deoxy-L-arabinose transferase-like glycosyltransferase